MLDGGTSLIRLLANGPHFHFTFETINLITLFEIYETWIHYEMAASAGRGRLSHSCCSTSRVPCWRPFPCEVKQDCLCQAAVTQSAAASLAAGAKHDVKWVVSDILMPDGMRLEDAARSSGGYICAVLHDLVHLQVVCVKEPHIIVEVDHRKHPGRQVREGEERGFANHSL